MIIEWSRAQRTQTPLSLDVDHFKLYNDLHGHQKGDDCLRTVAGAMAKNALRPADLSARYGGEEFAVLMPDTDHVVALKIGQRLRDSISRLRLIHGAPEAGAFVTISIGVCDAGAQGECTSRVFISTRRSSPVRCKTYRKKPRGLR
jgi:diguanylate cyclase (GGDEF)-like protein